MMTKRREEVHNAHMLIPKALWLRAKARGDKIGRTVTEVVVEALELLLGNGKGK